MLGMYLTTAVNFLAVDTPTISDGIGSIWSVETTHILYFCGIYIFRNKFY